MSAVQAVHAPGWAETLLSPAGGRKAKEGRTSDLRGVNVAVTAYVNGEPRTQLELLEGFQKIPFGTGELSCHTAVGLYLWNKYCPFSMIHMELPQKFIPEVPCVLPRDQRKTLSRRCPALC